MTVMDYRTQDGLAHYGFSIEFELDVGWRIYIIFQPLYEDQDSLQPPYQSIDHDERRYVNWSSRIDSLGEARTVAALWAELIQRCQRVGGRKGDNNVTERLENSKRPRTDAA